MAILMTGQQLADRCKDIANNYKTLYVYGCFGAPMNARNKERYKHNYAYNEQASRQKKINAASADTFGFDCVNLIKGILWGWNGNKNATYGGASYGINGVPDTSADGLMNYCVGVTSNFSNIQIGEMVHMRGHIGVYIGNGLAVECTPIWKDGVQITAVGNIGEKAGYNTRTWTDHGKLKFIDYGSTPTPEPGGFLPPRGYFQPGDSGKNVEKIDTFLANQTKGNFFGTYTQYATKAFQVECGLETDGNIGPITLGRMKDKGLDKNIKLPSRGYFKLGDSGSAIEKIDAFFANRIVGDYYGNFTRHGVMALQAKGKTEGRYNDVIDGNFGPMTLKCAESYGFKY